MDEELTEEGYVKPGLGDAVSWKFGSGFLGGLYADYGSAAR